MPGSSSGQCARLTMGVLRGVKDRGDSGRNEGQFQKEQRREMDLKKQSRLLMLEGWRW